MEEKCCESDMKKKEAEKQKAMELKRARKAAKFEMRYLK